MSGQIKVRGLWYRLPEIKREPDEVEDIFKGAPPQLPRIFQLTRNLRSCARCGLWGYVADPTIPNLRCYDCQFATQARTQVGSRNFRTFLQQRRP